jgi:uncharacterized protein YqjF (DUF2071 family)
VYFFSLDAGRRLAVAGARALLNLPYYFAGMTVERRGEVVDYQSERHGQHPADFKAVYETTSRPFLAMGAIFTRRYLREMHRPDAQHLIALLAALSKESNFAICCYCENPFRCHRSLLGKLLRDQGGHVRPGFK